MSPCYRIVRQDDNGVQYALEKKYNSRDEAEKEKERLERLGHKQTYWVEKIKE